jgi:two-component system OmpR family response regulator
MRILVVEDERRMAELLRQGLMEDGHAVTVAMDGHEGLAFAGAGGFDLLILDVMLPGISGLGIVRQLRASAIALPS